LSTAVNIDVLNTSGINDDEVRTIDVTSNITVELPLSARSITGNNNGLDF